MGSSGDELATQAPAGSGVSTGRGDPNRHDPRFVGPEERPDEYELIDSGHKGGEGIVFRGRYLGTLPKPVTFAIKQLLPPPGLNPSDWPDQRLVERWNEQLKLLHLVHHEHLVGYRALFWGWPPHPASTCTGTPPRELRTWYLVMDWVDGPSLHDVVRSNLVPISERGLIVADVADAVDHLHSGADTAGMALLHRDIKPGNVLVHPSRGAVLVDYGLLRVEEPTLTEIPAWTGPYLAPEVHADKTRCSRASDLWSVAATAFFAITGDHPTPFDAPHMRLQLEEALAGQANNPGAVVDAVMSVLERTPDDRPTSPSAWGQRLRASFGADSKALPHASNTASLMTEVATSTEGISSQTPSEESRHSGGNHLNYRRPRVVVMAIVLALLAAGTGILLSSAGPRPKRSDTSFSGRSTSGTIIPNSSTSSTSSTPATSAPTTAIPPTSSSDVSFFTSPSPGSVLNNADSISPAPVACGFSDPNAPMTFAPGFVGSAEPATSMALPTGSSDYFFVGADAGGNPLTQISWPEDLSVIAQYSSNKSISIGQSQTGNGSFNSETTTNVAIAGVGVTGYKLLTKQLASTPGGTSLSIQVSNPDAGILLLMVGGEGTGLLEVSDTTLQTLVNVTYSECGSNIIASVGMFAGKLPAGNYSISLSSTTYGTNSGASLGAVAYLLTPTQ